VIRNFACNRDSEILNLPLTFLSSKPQVFHQIHFANRTYAYAMSRSSTAEAFLHLPFTRKAFTNQASRSLSGSSGCRIRANRQPQAPIIPQILTTWQHAAGLKLER
jgi:hypothetical protein